MEEFTESLWPLVYSLQVLVIVSLAIIAGRASDAFLCGMFLAGIAILGFIECLSVEQVPQGCAVITLGMFAYAIFCLIVSAVIDRIQRGPPDEED